MSAPEGRARTIPRMGDPQPVLVAGTISRPPTTPSTQPSFEPVIFERERMPPPSYKSTVPRPVFEADLVEFFDWGLRRFLKIYPRATEATVRPWLQSVLRRPDHRFVRTERAFGLFYAERTPWEPELAVYDHFVVARARQGPEDRVMFQAQALEAPNIWKEGLRWANDIGAVTYQWGQATGVDLDPIAKMLGHDYKATGYVKVLRRAE